jgi:iron(III) transport system ATP-binding protein
VGLVFQDYALFPHLHVDENIGFGLRRADRAARKARVTTMLELVGLTREARKYPHELSGGQQQRVALARALAPQPALLLMDEPFSNLDVELRARLGAEVRQILKASDTTAILVTHDQQEAFAIADRVGVMQHGRLEQWDRPYELYHRPATRYVADFIARACSCRRACSTRAACASRSASCAVRCRCRASPPAMPMATTASSMCCCGPTM